MAAFTPVFTRPRTPELEQLDKQELIALLPSSIRQQVQRAEAAWMNIDTIVGKEVLDPADGTFIRDKRLSKEDILLLFDPPMDHNPALSREENYLNYACSDPVVWARVYLSINPRVYQILVLRDPSYWKLLRFGRRCGKTTTFAIRMLFKSWIRPGNKSILIAPMKAHASVTWDMIKEFFRNSPELQEIQKDPAFRMVEAPNYRIEFPNGSTIFMFTSGVRSKGRGDVLRGQEGDDIYLDEVDLMSPDDFASFTAILRDTGRGAKTLLAASTPNGRRDMMYQFATEMNIKRSKNGIGFKEFYFPTHADVNYRLEQDAQQRLLMTHNQYVHEIAADFGEEAAGVFLKGQIDRATEHYPDGYRYHNYKTMGMYRRSAHSKIVVGVDWDKYGAGTNIVVAEHDTRKQNTTDVDAGRFKIIARYEIPRSMTTLTDGVDAIKDINYYFQPDAIYLDRGYGEMQYETLLLSAKKGDDPRCVGLDKKLRGIHFNEAVEIFDPVTKRPVRKEIKDHMVTLTTRLFEQDRIILNSEDGIEAVNGSPKRDLIRQHEQYIVVGESITGKPRYEPSDPEVGDHALDGEMLCILAVDQEWGSFSLPDIHVAPVPIKQNLYEATGDTRVEVGTTDLGGANLKRAIFSRTNVGATRRMNGKRAFRRTNV